MSSERDQAILGSLLREITCTCRVCGCQGDSCPIGGGEKCAWLTTNLPKTLCNNPRCIVVAEARDRELERAKRRGVVRKKRGYAA